MYTLNFCFNGTCFDLGNPRDIAAIIIVCVLFSGYKKLAIFLVVLFAYLWYQAMQYL